MASKEHIKLLKRGVDTWNEWRKNNPGIVPDLSKAKLDASNLCGVNFEKANLKKANLLWADMQGANLQKADLREANLCDVNLFRANLVEADLRDAMLPWAKLIEANLSGANLERATLTEAVLRNANLSNVNLRHVILTDANGRSANLRGANLVGAYFTKLHESQPEGGFLELASAEGLEDAKFSDSSFLADYISEVFEFMHFPDVEEKYEYPDFFEKLIKNLKVLQPLLSPEDPIPSGLIHVVNVISSELIKYLKKHPKALYKIEPRQFEELIAEILAFYGWQVTLTQATKDGGYDLYGIVTDSSGLSTSWIIECKKYAAKNKVGVDIVRGLWGIKQDLRVANAMLATTSYFTKGVKDFKSSRYDLALRDYEGIVDWLNSYRPNPNGKLYIRDYCLRCPGKKRDKS